MEKSKKLERWQAEDAARLRELFREHQAKELERGNKVTQATFGEDHGIGSQGMMHQYLKPLTPLNLPAAVKFAKGLRCKVIDFSPTLAQQVIDAAPHAVHIRLPELVQLEILTPLSEISTAWHLLTPEERAQIMSQVHKAKQRAQRSREEVPIQGAQQTTDGESSLMLKAQQEATDFTNRQGGFAAMSRETGSGGEGEAADSSGVRLDLNVPGMGPGDSNTKGTPGLVGKRPKKKTAKR